MSKQEEVPICACDERYDGDGHEPECPVLAEIVRLRSQLAAAQSLARGWKARCREHEEARREESEKHYTVLSQRYTHDMATMEGRCEALRQLVERAEPVIKAAQAHERHMGAFYDFSVRRREWKIKTEAAVIEAIRVYNAGEGK